jgi:aspartyl-tRNA(Asn)/glutamyl-tRNA(Gln) amidotransferase subunit C
MTEISIETVRQVAALAALDMSDAECNALRGDLEAILAYVDQIETLETGPAEVTSNTPVAPLREDRVGTPHALSAEDVLRIAPARDGDFFRVPRVLRES